MRIQNILKIIIFKNPAYIYSLVGGTFRVLPSENILPKLSAINSTSIFVKIMNGVK